MKLIRVKCNDAMSAKLAISMISVQKNSKGQVSEYAAKDMWKQIKKELSPKDKEEVKYFFHSMFPGSNWWNA